MFNLKRIKESMPAGKPTGVTKSKTIEDLNNDCICEIFKYLSFKDLINIRKITRKFDRIIADSLKAGRELVASDFDSMDALEKFLKRFKRFIRVVKADLSEDNMTYHYHLNWYLRDRPIKSVNFVSKNIPNKMLRFWEPFLSRVDKIVIHDMTKMHFLNELLTSTENLQTLEFYNSVITAGFPEIKSLRTLSFVKCKFDHKDKVIQKYISRFDDEVQQFKLNEDYCIPSRGSRFYPPINRHYRHLCNCIHVRIAIENLSTQTPNLKSISVLDCIPCAPRMHRSRLVSEPFLQESKSFKSQFPITEFSCIQA